MISLMARSASVADSRPVAEVAEAGHDELAGIEPLVDDRRVDVHVGMAAFDGRDAFGRRDDAEQMEVAGAELAQRVEREHRAAAGREHRVDHQHARVGEADGEARVVLRRDGRLLVALQADVADAGAGQQLEDGLEHAEAGAQHRHHHDFGAHAPAGRRPDGRLDAVVSLRQVARRLERQDQADAPRHLAERVGRRLLVPQREQDVLRNRMVDDVKRHGRHCRSKAARAQGRRSASESRRAG